MMNWLENITDKDFLQDNMTFASLYIAVYENLIDYVASNIKFFLCDYALKDGKEVCRETEAYKVQIKNRIVDEKGNRNAIKAPFLWLVDRGAITVSEYGRFLELKEIRNRYAHEMVNVIYHGIDKVELGSLFDLLELYRKIGRWFFLNIEAVIMGEDLPEEADLEKVRTGPDIMFGIILDVLYNRKSEEYKELIRATGQTIVDQCCS